MGIVLSAIKLSLILGGFTAYLLGLGWLGFKLVTQKQHENGSLLQILPLALTSGLIINLGLSLVLQDLIFVLIIGLMLSVIGLFYFVRDIIYPQTRIEYSIGSPYAWTGVFLVLLVFLSPIFVNPIKDWDARTIWFFHGKMIYIAGSIGQEAGWQHPSVIFSHPDYPKLVPLLAAEIMTMAGHWNEYLPKASLLILLLPAILWLFSFARKAISFAVILLLIPFTFDRLIWNGYMDGYLAVYFAIALLLLGKYMQSSQTVDLISGLSCLVLLLYIKNEGSLAALTGICSFLFIFLYKRNMDFWHGIGFNWKYFLAGVLALLPFFVWIVYKWQWGISNDLDIGTAQSISRIAERVTSDSSDSYRYILGSMFDRVEAGLLILTLLYFAISWRNAVSKEALPALLAAAIYCLGLFAIYLLTPYDLEWHIKTSLDRTMLTANAGIYVSCYFMLKVLESKTQEN